MLTDIDIAQAASLKPIVEVAAKLGLHTEDLTVFGRYMAKLSPICTAALKANAQTNGKLILVTAISPTPAGEGKTTTTIGLADALNLALKDTQQKAMVCIREPSLGPVFGKKGGATGGGYAQVLPMEDINLHFTGDFHAISSANNLLAALIDNHLYHGNALNIDPASVTWRRCVDMNDRALRHVSLNTPTDKSHKAYTRETAFDITVASEVMAIFCLANSLADLQTRLGNIQIGHNFSGEAILARDLQAEGAMTALLKNAFQPNLVQTIAHTPAIVHGGPFANIAHGCNSIVATQAALKLADFVVTEAGFGADLGAEKFIDIKCRQMAVMPEVVVLVATVRALKYHGGVEVAELNAENLDALRLGMANLQQHIANLTQHFGLQVIVAINHFTSDTAAEITLLQTEVAKLSVQAVVCTHWATGAVGALDLAHAVLNLLANSKTETPNVVNHANAQLQLYDANTEQVKGFSRTTSAKHLPPKPYQYLYPLDASLLQKIETIAQKIYGAKRVELSEAAQMTLAALAEPYRHFPVCIAKTQYSFSSDASLRGAPKMHILQVRELRLSRGAGFVVVICGDLMTMPGLPKTPASEQITVKPNGQITGLS